MSVFKIVCKTLNCKAEIQLDTGKWNKDQKVIDIHCPKCNRLVQKYNNPNFAKNDDPIVNTGKGRTQLMQSNENYQSEENLNASSTVGWLMDKNSKRIYGITFKKQTVGRKSSSKPSDVLIETTDNTLSGGHCMIEAKKMKTGEIVYTISDHDSKNGVMINGKRKLVAGEVLYLDDGDVITLGLSLFAFVSFAQAKSKEDAIVWLVNHVKSLNDE